MSKTLSLTALTAVLALAACNKPAETTDNAMVDVANASALDTTPTGSPVVENAVEAAAVAVPAVPRPAPGAIAADAAPLNNAAAIEDQIRAGNGIERVRYGEGWAWTRGGRIIRTADRGGRNIAYFRPGEDKPFFIQQADRSYAYRDGKPVREFGARGHGRAPDAAQIRKADEAARQADRQRDRAEQARQRARPGERGDQRPGNPEALPAPGPAPTASATPEDRGAGERDGEGRPEREPGNEQN